MTRPTDWLDVMLGEIARKRDEAAAAHAEQQRRDAERDHERNPRAPDPAR